MERVELLKAWVEKLAEVKGDPILFLETHRREAATELLDLLLEFAGWLEGAGRVYCSPKFGPPCRPV